MRSEPRFHFTILTCRDPDTDFRQPLAEALTGFGPVTYVWVRRRPVVYDAALGPGPHVMGLPQFLAFMVRRRPDDAIPVYLNSTNTYFPGLSLLLRLITPTGLWCFDLHDDLRYHNTGLKRVTEALILRLLVTISHEVVHAAPTLRALVPGSRHLGNASHLSPLPRDRARADAVLILASFDERLDFPLLQAVMTRCPALSFHLHGWVRTDDAATRSALDALLASCPNAQYHGPYAMGDLPEILGRHKVTFAPYRTRTSLTEFIDPLRFYHCLNAGLEVVSTPIPQAEFMGQWVHIVTDVDTTVRTLRAILDDDLTRQPGYTPITWTQKAARLVAILQGGPRFSSLVSRREGAVASAAE